MGVCLFVCLSHTGSSSFVTSLVNNAINCLSSFGFNVFKRNSKELYTDYILGDHLCRVSNIFET